MDEEKTQRELLHELGNVLQEKVALQYLLGQAADQIERLVDGDADEAAKETARKAAERFRRSSTL